MLRPRSSFAGEVLARRIPTYFGVLVALFRGEDRSYKVRTRNFKNEYM